MDEHEMKIYIPIDIDSSLEKSAKSGKDDEGDWYVRGYASTPHLDLQNEIVQPSGIDIDYFVKSGWLNYEHKQDAEYVVGVPTENCRVDFNKGLFVEAKLIKDNPYAKQMWELANNIKKSGINRKIGFSIEGAIKKRNHLNSNIIEEVMIRNVALTKAPANQATSWESFVKSMETGHEVNPENMQGLAALRTEDLAQAITHLTYTYKLGNPKELDQLWKDVNGYLDKVGRNDREAKAVVLQIARGLSKEDALEFVDKVEKGE